VSDEEGRVFLRGITSETYGLGEQRRKQRAAPRVIAAGTVTDDASVGHSGDSDEGLSKAAWMLGPGDDPFRTQTLHVHYVELLPGGSNHGHVANEPTTWEFTNGDVLYVPQNTVHQVFADGDEPRGSWSRRTASSSTSGTTTSCISRTRGRGSRRPPRPRDSAGRR
jgi:quercetin dioxygenase-like cupin family protein